MLSEHLLFKCKILSLLCMFLNQRSWGEMSFTTMFSHLAFPCRDFLPLSSIYSLFTLVSVNWQLLEEVFCALIRNRNNAVKHPWSDQLSAIGCNFTVLAVSISPCCNTELYSTSRWQQKILLPVCFGRTAAYGFPYLFTLWMHVWPWPGM